VFAPLFSRLSSNKGLKVDLGGHYLNSWHSLVARLQGFISDEALLPPTLLTGRVLRSDRPFGKLSAIRRGSFSSVKDLVAAIRRFIDAWNECCEPFEWTKEADKLIQKATRKKTSLTKH
jgi:hypothetical protein